MMEYIGAGINLGLSLPFSPQYQFHFGVTNFQSLNASNLLIAEESEATAIIANSSALSLGLTIDIPRLSSNNTVSDPTFISQAKPINEQGKAVVIETNKKIIHYQDTIKICIQEIRNLSNENQLLKQELSLLEDSTRTMFLDSQIEQS